MLDIGVCNLMSFLKDKYLIHMANIPKPCDETPSLDGFISFAQKYLAEENQPLQVTYLPKGLGLRLQHGETVGFIDNKVEAVGMCDEGIPITRPKSIPGMHGVTDTGGVSVFDGRP